MVERRIPSEKIMHHWRIAVAGVALIAFSYLLVNGLVAYVQPDDLSVPERLTIENQSGSVTLFWLLIVIVPYAIGGTLLGQSKLSNIRSLMLVGLVATLGERLLILGLATLVLAGFRHVSETGAVHYVEGTSNLLLSIQSEALPYYGWPYLILGIPISLAVLSITARWVSRVHQPNASR